MVVIGQDPYFGEGEVMSACYNPHIIVNISHVNQDIYNQQQKKTLHFQYQFSHIYIYQNTPYFISN